MCSSDLFPSHDRRGTFTSKDPVDRYNPSSLYSYIGWEGTRSKTITDIAEKNAIPALIYLDIFKNYFANTQEDNFYIITGSTEATVTFEQQNEDAFTTQVGQDAEKAWITPMNNTVTLQASDNVKKFGDFWTSLVIKVYNPSNGSSLTVYINNATTNYSTKKITLDKIGKDELAGYTTIQGVYIKTPVSEYRLILEPVSTTR